MERLGLPGLADELLLAIIEQIDTHEALCNLALANHRFQELTEPFIWRKLQILTGSHAKGVSTALRSRQDRLEMVHDLALHYAYDEEIGIKSLDRFIGQMDKLRHLTIESPCPNNSEWRSGIEFTGWTKVNYWSLIAESVDRYIPTRPLQMLQSLIIHGHGKGHQKFEIGQVASIFLHPTVRSITLSCVNFGGDKDLISAKDIPEKELKSTQLKSLTLIECNIYLDLLEVALSLPKALEELHLGERLFAWRECFPKPGHLNTSHPRFLSVLALQKDSLQRLTHISGSYAAFQRMDHDSSDTRQDTNTPTVSLSDFLALTHLEFDIDSTLQTALERSQPAKMQSLRITDAVRAVSIGNALLPAPIYIARLITLCAQLTSHFPSKYTPDLAIMFAAQSYADETLRNIHTFFSQQPYRQIVYELARTMKARGGGRLRILGERFPSGNSYIPPFMHGEERPVEVGIYDSENEWVFGGDSWEGVDKEEVLED